MSTTERVTVTGSCLVLAALLSGCGGGPSASPVGTSTPAAVVPSPTSEQVSTPTPGATMTPVSTTGATTPSVALTPARAVARIAPNDTVGAGTIVAGGTTIGQLSVTARDGTTAAVITAPLRAWHTDGSTPDKLMFVPVPTVITGRYRLTNTDALRTSATAIVVP